MRNLKKVLSLVLCLAVMLSVMVVGAGAAFSDQDKIENTEAVDACSALNIINGYEDGAFHPERNIKRAEVTKMICVALNGGEEPNTSTNAKPTFTDVRGTIYAWAEGYIESCYAQGIVDGVNGNRFAPASNVTAAQLAKMLLVSLGYNAKTEQFTGNAWETNVNVRAAQKHLYDGLEKMDTSAPVTRDQAAQMVWNAMQAYEVEYKDGVVQDKVVGSTNDKITLLRDRYDAWVYVGTLTEVDSTNITITMNAADRDASDPKPNSDVTSKSFSKIGQDYSSLLGQKVKVLFKDGKSNDVIGIYATSDNTVYKTLMNAVELDGNKIKFNGTSYSVDNTKKIATTFVGIDGTKTENQAIAYFDSADKADDKTSLNEVTFVDSDANNKIDTAIVLEKKAAEVTNVSSDKITFDGKSYKFADEKIDKDIAQDDWAVMSVDLYNDCKSIVKAGVLTTTVDSYKAKTGYHQYQLDGTWYNISDKAYNDAGVSTGDTVKAYVSNGVIVKMKADDGKGGFPSNIAVVVGVGSDNSSKDGNKVDIRLFDGTIKEVTLSDKSNTPDLGMAYKISGSDKAMKFEAVKEAIKYNGYSYVGTEKTADPTNDKIGEDKVDDSAVVILYTENGRSKQITGKQFNALTTTDLYKSAPNKVSKMEAGEAGAVFTKDKNGLNRVMMASVMVENINIAGKSSDNYGYIVEDATENKTGDVSYTIWTTDNKYVDVVEEGTYSATNRQKGTLIGYSSISSEGIISDVDDVVTLKTLATKGKEAKNGTTFEDDGTVYYGGNESETTKMVAVDGVKLNVTADTKVLFVDSAADEDKEGNPTIGMEYTYGTTKMHKAVKNTDNKTYATNVFFLADETGTDDIDLKVLVLDTTGAFDGYAPKDPVTPEKPDAGKEYKTADELKAALAAGDVTATGVVPAGDYNSKNTLTLKDAKIGDKITSYGNVTLDGATTFSSTGSLEVLGTLTIKDGATVDLSKVTAGGAIVNEKAALTDAEVDALLAKSNDVTVKDVSDALTVDAANKTLTLANAKAALTVTAAKSVKVTGAVTGNLTVTKGDVTVAKDVSGAIDVDAGKTIVKEAKGNIDVAAAASLEATTIDFTKTITTASGATLTVTGDVTNDVTLAAATAGTTVFNGKVTGKLTLDAASNVEFGSSIEITDVIDAVSANKTQAGAKLTFKVVPAYKTPLESNADGFFATATDGATAVTGASDIKLNVVYTNTASKGDGNSHNGWVPAT